MLNNATRLNLTLILGIAVTLAAGLVVGLTPANAAEPRLTPTATVLKVIPGQGNLFQDKDPIRICFGIETDQATDHRVWMTLDSKATHPDAEWETIASFTIPANTIRCLTSRVHGFGDIAVRARVMRTPHYNWTTSRIVIVHVAARPVRPLASSCVICHADSQ